MHFPTRKLANMNRWHFLLRSLALGSLSVIAAGIHAQEPVSFNRDVRPILTAHCFACHGPDEKSLEADLRLDQRDSAIETEAIVPKKPDQSSLVARIYSTDPDLIMPPPHSDRVLTEQQKAVLKRWIAEGAEYKKHWAFQTPQSVLPPRVSSSDWIRNPIDNFVLHQLERSGLQPSAEADRYVLARRLYLDLIGLPPTIEEADEFVQSKDPQAYEKLVDRLLASERYGERWAQPWLDLARYADTNGYEKDRERSIWPYRDWVIRSLNADLPYDQFSIEQLAGDMLDNPTPNQLIATGFHRNTMLNEEGGIDPLEYRYLAMVDRVATTGTVWLGLTTGCAQCHTHKYDPISQTDYFRMMALLNNAEEPDYYISDSLRQTEIDQAKRAVAELEKSLVQKFPPQDLENEIEGDNRPSLENSREQNLQTELQRWITRKQNQVSAWKILRPVEMNSNLPKLEVLEDGSIFATGDTTKRDVFEFKFTVGEADKPIQSLRIEALPDSRLPGGGPGRCYYEGRKGDFFVSEVDVEFKEKPIEFNSASTSFGAKKDGQSHEVFDGIGSSGWRPGAKKRTRLQLVMNLKQPIEGSGTISLKLLFERHYTASLGRLRVSASSNREATANQLDENVEHTLATKTSENWSIQETADIQRAFLLETPLLSEARKQILSARMKIPELNHSLIMAERPEDHLRPTHRHHRGEWLSPREQVTPSIPAFLLQPGIKSPENRLEFAKWLVSKNNPLAARVSVNRAWREIFGVGLMKTNGDFGVQTALPVHHVLLDWLAVQFQNEFKWSNKRLHRLIVTSATYRQSSTQPPDGISDPDNRLLSRGPSFRVTGEIVRDTALQATGSLSTKMYGPGVRPPQPPAVTGLAWGRTNWKPSTGEDRVRRSVYTFRKRTATFAAYSVFDGPTGEACVAKRNRSNTPLQALNVLNDEMFVELAKKMGIAIDGRYSINNDRGNSTQKDQAALERIFRSFLTRPPSTTELSMLMEFYRTQIDRLEAREIEATEIAGIGGTHRQAALAMVARAVMNLDETVTKR